MPKASSQEPGFNQASITKNASNTVDFKCLSANGLEKVMRINLISKPFFQ
jgi:hypothetical protein